MSIKNFEKKNNVHYIAYFSLGIFKAYHTTSGTPFFRSKNKLSSKFCCIAIRERTQGYKIVKYTMFNYSASAQCGFPSLFCKCPVCKSVLRKRNSILC